MIGPRALFGFAFALVVVGAAMGLSDPGGTPPGSTQAGASAVDASPAEAGKTRGPGGATPSPAGKPGAVAAAWSAVENDRLTTGSTDARASTAGLLGDAGTGDRRASRSVDPAARPGSEGAKVETSPAPEAKNEAQDPNSPKPPARVRLQKPAAPVLRSQGPAAQRQRDARPEAGTFARASVPQPARTGASARVIDESAFLR